MNILVINGSPKNEKSNTYRLTKAFVDGIKTQTENTSEISSVDVETIEAGKLNIKPCRGCFSCWNKTAGECVIQDDMQNVIQKLLWADVTIWSFPLYYFGVPGPLKNLIDRQLPMTLPFMSANEESGGHPSRYDMKDKKTVVISTCGFYTSKGNYDGVTAMFDRMCGQGNYTSIFCGQGELFRVKELSNRTDEYLSFVKTAGAEYASGKISDDTYKKLNEDLYPRDVFETMADASWGIDKNGEKEDDSLVFTKQMAALYNKNSYNGHDIILEMNYTDIGKTYRVILGKNDSTVTDDLSGHYTTQINTPLSVWRSIASGEIAGDEALMKHLYSVDGDFNLMIKWDEYFGADKNEKTESATDKPQQKTNMTLLLIPWIVFWVVASINSFYGSLLSVATCALMPLILHKTKQTVYDKLSAIGVSLCSIALLMGASPVLVVPLSYLLFGLMWSLSCFTKIPLTAHYSKNDYNGDKALKNPLFMKTNLILTAAWGVLYLLTPIWTYFLMQTNIGSFIGAINSVLPALMGIFTAWFQKWYPKHVAKGK